MNILDRLSLRWKLILILLLLNFSLMFSLYIFYSQTEKKLLKEIERQTADLTKAIQIGVEEVTKGGSNKLTEYLKKLNTKGIREVSIISNTQEIIASTNPQNIGKPITHSKKELIIKAELGEPVFEEENVYNVIIPVIAGNVQYGYIHLRINKDDFSHILKTNALKRILTTLMIFFIGIVVTYIISLRYTKPINTLTEAAKKVAQGDFKYRLNINRKDEIGKIAESFNFMIQKLQENQILHERLREAEHLSAIGQLSRTIAHEVRNPLNFINLSIDHLIEKLQKQELDSDNYIKLLENMKQEIYRVNNLITEYLEYTRPLKLNKKLASIIEIIEDVVSLVEATGSKYGINIYKDYEVDFTLNLDVDLIKSCFLNIITNALYAMKDSDMKNLFIKTELSEDNLLIKISDTGSGVPEEYIDKIFEPFFSTKKGGLGLGLSLSKRVIEEHGGKIEFSSRQGNGSEVKIYIPI
ncbi:MAG TPA: ATP-binding protein [Thermodesulfovibrio thiophilus]|uniref:sensor histidine kinase n=1 Tax=Thermodesulfovibrio thiophilus TaxID=340095 RepID=UPI0023568F08|nr:HAMP domain-containing sensor histidine kinase [Thermodesulfovibrio thiophilus]HQD35969.1 ATP-binding protein [Thermodesulfovibrio thiophilus]